MMRGGSNNVMSSDKGISQRGARELLKIIEANKYALRNIRNGETHFQRFNDLNNQAKRGEPFSDKQLSLINDLYEKMWKGIDANSNTKFGSFSTTYKHNPRKTLRY